MLGAKAIRGKIESFYKDKLGCACNLKSCNVHLIHIKEKDDKILIKILAERPGFLIGLKGLLVNELKEKLVYELLKSVEIEFNEFNPFRDEFRIG